MSVKQEDVKPAVPEIDVFNIPVEEEELEFGPRFGHTKIWAMKIPSFLYERWERVQTSGVHLGTLLVDNSSDKPRITLQLPKEMTGEGASNSPKSEADTPDSSTSLPRIIPEEYNVDMLGGADSHVKNRFVFSEHKRTWVANPGDGQSSAKKRKTEKAHPCLIGKVDHEVNVRAIQSPQYLRLLAERQSKSQEMRQKIALIDETTMGRGKLNQLASGFANAKSTLGKGMIAGSGRGTGERHARMEKHDLIDQLFALFRRHPYWDLTALRTELKQPDQWLREVLKDVAEVVQSGPYINKWQLKEDWKPTTDSAEPKGEKGEEDEEDDSEFEDESDLEEVQVIE